MKVSQRVSSLTPSLTLALTAKANAMKKQGIDVVSFGAGEPDFGTPDFITEVAIEDLRAGRTKYTASDGGPEIIDAVRQYMKREYALEYDAKQVLISVGGKHSLFNVFLSMVDPGDEVIIPAPYWLTYPEQVIAAGGTPVFVSCPPEQGFKLTPEQLKAKITSKTVALVLNSPSNPTGAVYSKEELLALGEVLLANPQVNIISDDLYQKLVYAPAEFHSIVSLVPDLKDRTVIVNGWSKAYSMTGWRLGWTVGPRDLLAAMSNLQSHATSNVTTFCQRAGALALTGDQSFLSKWVEEFDARRRMIVDGLNAIPGFSCKPAPQGAFYAFPDVSALFGQEVGGKVIKGSMDVAEVALEKAKVSLVPGNSFGEDRCVRLSYATSRELIQKGLDRLAMLVGAAVAR